MKTNKQALAIIQELHKIQSWPKELSENDFRWVMANFSEAMGIATNAIVNRNNQTTSSSILSEVINKIHVPATSNKFIVQDWFIVDSDEHVGIGIKSIGNNFVNWFMDKTEDPFCGSNIGWRKLKEDANNHLILSGLGGEKKAETKIYEIVFMMINAKYYLLNGDYANVFFARDINNTLRAVDVHVDESGNFHIGARSLECSNEQEAGNYLFTDI